MAHREKITVEISTDNGPISSGEFIQFMFFFRAVYIATVLELERGEDTHRWLERSLEELDDRVVREAIETVERRFRSPLAPDIGRLGSSLLARDIDLEIHDIRRRNPISILFIAVPLAIVVAGVVAGGGIILSGKNVSIKDKKLTLPDLKNSISYLRKFSSYVSEE